jgi:hypothetical protein
MEARETEIGEHAVAQELGYEPVAARDRARTRVLIGADDLPHVLGIEPRRHRGRTAEISEHDDELTAFGYIWRFGGWTRRLNRDFRRDKRCNRLEEAFTMAHGHAKLTEFTAVRSGRTSPSISFSRNVAETEVPKPTPDVHRRFPNHSNSMIVEARQCVQGVGPEWRLRGDSGRSRRTCEETFATIFCTR